MYAEELGKVTAAHYREHIAAYLEELEAYYADNVKLIVPRAVETSNLVGGVYAVDAARLPAVAVDVMNKSFAGVGDSDWLYAYEGHLAVIVGASSESAANTIIKRYQRATERFVREHQYLHQVTIVDGEAYMHELGFNGSAFSGAAKLDEENNRQSWVAGARVDVIWVLRELGAFQHG